MGTLRPRLTWNLLFFFAVATGQGLNSVFLSHEAADVQSAETSSHEQEAPNFTLLDKTMEIGNRLEENRGREMGVQKLKKYHFGGREDTGRPFFKSLEPLFLATAHFAASFLGPFTLMVAQSGVDEVLVQTLWAAGAAVGVMEEAKWLSWLEGASHYRQVSQHVLVGSTSWLRQVMSKVRPLYLDSRLNIKTTQWLWVMVEEDVTKLSFPDLLEYVKEPMVEGTRGLLLRRRRPREMQDARSAVAHETTVDIFAVADEGNGTWGFVVAASWVAPSGLALRSPHRPLWPSPPKTFGGRHLRLTCLFKPRVFEYDAVTGLRGAQGYTADLVHVLQEHLDFTGTLVPAVGFGSRSANGSWNGMVGALARHEADWGILDFSPSDERNQVVEFSIPYSWDNVVILAKAPDFIVKPFLLLQIFSPLVWAALVGAVLTGAMSLWVVENVETSLGRFEERHPPSLLHRFATVFGVYVQQAAGDREWPFGSGGRVLTACLLMTGVIVCATYSGSVTAFLAIPFRAKAIDSLEDLAHSSVLPSVRTRVSVYNFLLQNNYTGAMARLKLNLKQFSGTYMSSWEYFKQVEEAKYAFIDTFSSAVGRSIEHENDGGQCRFRVARTIVKSDVDTFAYARNTPIRHRVDKTLTWLRYYGIIEHLRNKYFSLPCFDEITNDGPKSLDVNQAQGAFYVLFLGYCACVACFVSELMISIALHLRQGGDVA